MHNPPETWSLETWQLIEERKFTEAAEKIQQALVRDSRDPEAHNMKGYLLAQQGSNREAKKHFRRALDCDPKNGRLRAYILNNLLRPKEGLEVIDAYLAENPDDDYGWDAKAVNQMQLGSHLMAQASLAKAIEINSENRLAYQHKLVLSKLLKHNYNIIACWICNARVRGKGLEPIPYWNIPFDLCADCYQEYISATKTRHVTCVELLENTSSITDGVLLVFSLGNKARIVFEPVDKKVFPIIIEQDVLRVDSVVKDDKSGRFVAVSESDSDVGRHIRVDYLIDGKQHSLIFSLNKEYFLMLTFMKDAAAKMKRSP